ncbi:hypothetical protein AK812_SmicGene21615 [Symbiodinium microadriaticum]|uniref:Uncharacterized protein n=1 Tax=Symbiodinium microadriaticum TaxID=2951 RepID=A0A1Q9DLV1_SYMMI|nr:hypothetical protein AK812_SmicGene21615 [Symbiodinium microadriaticum]
MVTFSVLVIPEISNTILTYLLPSLLTLTFELDLPAVSHLTGVSGAAIIAAITHILYKKKKDMRGMALTGVKGSMTPPGLAGPAASTPNINPFTPGAPPRTPSNLPGSANAPTTPVAAQKDEKSVKTERQKVQKVQVVFEQRSSSSLLIATEAEGEQDVQPAPPPPQLGVYELHQQDAREILYQALRAQPPLSMPSEATVSQHRVSSRQSDVVNF